MIRAVGLVFSCVFAPRRRVPCLRCECCLVLRPRSGSAAQGLSGRIDPGTGLRRVVCYGARRDAAQFVRDVCCAAGHASPWHLSYRLVPKADLHPILLVVAGFSQRAPFFASVPDCSRCWCPVDRVLAAQWIACWCPVDRVLAAGAMPSSLLAVFSCVISSCSQSRPVLQVYWVFGISRRAHKRSEQGPVQGRIEIQIQNILVTQVKPATRRRGGLKGKSCKNEIETESKVGVSRSFPSQDRRSLSLPPPACYRGAGRASKRRSAASTRAALTPLSSSMYSHCTPSFPTWAHTRITELHIYRITYQKQLHTAIAFGEQHEPREATLSSRGAPAAQQACGHKK